MDERDLTSGRVLVTGAAGMLGSELCRTAPAGLEPVGTDLAPEPHDGVPVQHVGVDLTDAEAVRALLSDAGPLQGVIHAAAYTAVDRAEEEPDLAQRANAHAAGNVAAAAAEAGVPVVCVGTDFVFDGTKGAPYVEDDPPAPLGVYGRTKRAGEELALAAHPSGCSIVRTQWLYGPRGHHFPGTMLRLAAERDSLRVVHDQVGSPTTTIELAPALWDVLRAGAPGIYHAACEGQCSWYDLAAATIEEAGITGVEIEPCSTQEYPTPARRPAFSVLDCTKLSSLRGQRLAPWREALKIFLRAERVL